MKNIVYTNESIITKKKSILLVIRDEDGDWQCSSGEQLSLDKARIISFEQMILLDASTKDLANLKLNKYAIRNGINDNWKIHDYD